MLPKLKATHYADYHRARWSDENLIKILNLFHISALLMSFISLSMLEIAVNFMFHVKARWLSAGNRRNVVLICFDVANFAGQSICAVRQFCWLLLPRQLLTDKLRNSPNHWEPFMTSLFVLLLHRKCAQTRYLDWIRHQSLCRLVNYPILTVKVMQAF